MSVVVGGSGVYCVHAPTQPQRQHEANETTVCRQPIHEFQLSRRLYTERVTLCVLLHVVGSTNS